MGGNAAYAIDPGYLGYRLPAGPIFIKYTVSLTMENTTWGN